MTARHDHQLRYSADVFVHRQPHTPEPWGTKYSIRNAESDEAKSLLAHWFDVFGHYYYPVMCRDIPVRFAPFALMGQTERMSHEEFSRLVDLWHEDIRFSSSVDEIERSRYYVQILKGGGEVVPFIIEELKKEPDFWFSALEMITGANPVPEDAEGDLYAMSEYWIEWFEHGENDRERSA